MGLVKKVLDLFRKKEADSCLDASTREFHAGIERAAIFGTLIAACQYGYHGKGFYLLHEEMREGLETSLNKYIAGVQNKLADGTIKEERRYAKSSIKAAKVILKSLGKEPHKFPVLFELYSRLLHPEGEELDDYEERSLDNTWSCLFKASNQAHQKKEISRCGGARTFEDYTDLDGDKKDWASINRMNPSVEGDISRVCSFKLPEMGLADYLPEFLTEVAFSVKEDGISCYGVNKNEIISRMFKYVYPALRKLSSLKKIDPSIFEIAVYAIHKNFVLFKYDSSQEAEDVTEQRIGNLVHFFEKVITNDKLKSRIGLLSQESVRKGIYQYQDPRVGSNNLFKEDQVPTAIDLLWGLIEGSENDPFCQDRTDTPENIDRLCKLIEIFDSFKRNSIVQKLGRGGMGTAYMIRDKCTHKALTLKIIDPPESTLNKADRLKGEGLSLRQMLEDEITNTKNITSRYIAQIHEVSTAGFIIREYFDTTLETELKAAGGRFPEEVVKSYAKQLVEGMADAHRAGVLHRDFGLNNVGIDSTFVTDFETDKIIKEPELKIFDFGVSSYFDYQPGHSFIAGIDSRDPRIISGEIKKYDKKCDVYSLGAVVYIMLTGESPAEYEGPRNSKDYDTRKKQNAQTAENYGQAWLERKMQKARCYTSDPFILRLIEKTICPPESRFEDAEAVYRAFSGN